MHLKENGTPIFGIARWDLTAENGVAIPQADFGGVATTSCAELAKAAVRGIDDIQHQCPEVTWSAWWRLFCFVCFCLQREMASTHSTAQG